MQNQYKVIYLALNEEFKADVKPQSLSDFTEHVKSLTEKISANQDVIRKQFKVKNKLRIFNVLTLNTEYVSRIDIFFLVL